MESQNKKPPFKNIALDWLYEGEKINIFRLLFIVLLIWVVVVIVAISLVFLLSHLSTNFLYITNAFLTAIGLLFIIVNFVSFYRFYKKQ